MSNPGFLSKRQKKRSQSGLTTDRYEFLGLDQAEADLGDPLVGISSIGAKPKPLSGDVYVVAAFSTKSNSGFSSNRYWVAANELTSGLSLAPGSFTVFNNNVQVGLANSFNKFNFVGTGVTVDSVGSNINEQTGIATIRITVNDATAKGAFNAVQYHGAGDLIQGASDFSYNPNTGQVGIGTLLPSTTLDVIGNARITGILTVGSALILNGGTNTVLSTDLTTQQLNVTGVATIAQANITNLNATGISTLGITNTTSLTAQQLNVTGVTTFAGITTVTGQTLFTQQFNALGFSTFNSRVAVGTQIALDANSGVITAARFDGAFSGIVTSATNLVGGVANASSLNVTGIATFAGITTVTGETLFTKQLNVSGFSTFVGVGTFLGNLFVGEDLIVKNNLSFNSFAAINATVTGLTTLGITTISVNSPNNALRITQTGTGNALVVEDDTNPDSTPFVIDSSGFVGIGTTNPTARLTIFGDPLIIGTSNFIPTSTGVAGIFSGTTSNDLVRITQLGTGNALVVEDEANPDATPFVITGVGSVGIGVTTPISKLEISGGDILLSNGFFLKGRNTVGSATTLIGRNSIDELIVGDPSFNNPTRIISGNNSIRLETNNVERVRVSSDGNVGIATITPQKKLDVNAGDIGLLGTANASNEQFGVQYREPTVNAMLGGIAFNRTATTGAPTDIVFYTNKSNNLSTSFSSANEVLRITNSGNIGIGITNPASPLTVSGLTSTTNLFVSGAATFAQSNPTNLSVAGVATIATLGVTGVTTTKFLSVTGVATVATLGVTGVTTTQFLSVTGVSTFAGTTNVTSTTDSTSSSTGALIVSGGIGVSKSVNIGNNLNVSGISTFAGNVSVGGSLTVAVIRDSNNSIGSTGAFLRCDSNFRLFWDNTPFGDLLPTGPLGAVGLGTTAVNLYAGAITRGYTLGGYQNSVAFKKVYKTNHATDTTTDLGAILSFYAAYTDATSSSRFAYTFDSHSASGQGTAGKDINKFDMTTDSNISFATQMNATKGTNTNILKYRFIRAYVFGDTDPEKFVFATETPTVASTTWTDANSLQWRQRAYGDNRGFIGKGGSTTVAYQLDFSSETWSTWSPPSGTLSGSFYGTWSTYAGYIYWKTGATNARKFNSSTATATLLSVTTTSNQEENFHTGESKGYMVGAHNGSTFVNTGSILDYVNDSYRDVASVNAPDINSSGGGTEFGRTGL